MVCGATFSFNNDLSYYPLLALQLIDGSGFSVNKLHFNELKRLYPRMEFSKLAGTGAGATGPGATSWIIISTITNGERLDDLGKQITDVMKILTAIWLKPQAADPLVQFAGGGFTGTLLVGKNNIYVATWDGRVQELNCYNPADAAISAISATVPTLITNVNYSHRGFLDDVRPFDNAKAVVAKALGAVAAGTILDRAQSRPENQSIRQASEGTWRGGVRGYGYNVLRVMSGMGGRGLAYIKSKKSWKLVNSRNWEKTKVVDELSASLEKIRKKVDRIELQGHHPPVEDAAQDRFEMLKGIAANFVELANLAETALGFSGGGCNLAVNNGLGLPASFIERSVDLKTSLFNEKPVAYTALQWDAKFEFYRGQIGKAVDVLATYHGGRVQQLNAIGQARHYIQPAEEIFDPEHPHSRDALQGAAGLLSSLEIMKGKLRHIAKPPTFSRDDLRYSYKTGLIKFNDGKKRTLTMMKIKEQGSQAVYLGVFPEFSPL